MQTLACSGHKISAPRPQRRRTLVHPIHIKKAIQHAKNLCYNYENTQECRIAWECVEELSAEMNRQVSEKSERTSSPEM